ncbi:amino acid-binding protein [Methanocella sp. CWC-04]|uniref:Amino acid-binding protein n=1 Tax=Methanooceanicella nereidis TaxID=2052831 RepID=A0AAP2RE13_9EURY|nr:amino acid-binding protein [Methanocella sp. CWC-04]MCD1295623.1 amino acid-binding protein [Methanocella sp. CWC-04]
MWSEIIGKFKGMPSQEKVIRVLLERGFQVNAEGHVVSGAIEIPHTQIAKEVGVDRRVVDATTEMILKDEVLKRVFMNIRSIASLRDVAPMLGLGVIIITPDNAQNVGIITDVTSVIARYNLSIRQAVTDDPFFSDDPKMTLITNDVIPGELVSDLRKLKNVRSVTIL